MAVYYVSNSELNSCSVGDDAYDGTAPVWAGGVSTVGPKLTVTGAQNIAGLGGSAGDVIQINEGTYREATNNGRFALMKNYTNVVTYEPYVAGTTVTITGTTGHGQYEDFHICRAATINNYHFRNLTFTNVDPIDGSPGAVMSSGGSAGIVYTAANLTFTGCSFAPLMDETPAELAYSVYLRNTAVNGLRFIGCTFSDTSTHASSNAVHIQGDITGTGTKVVTNIEFTDCVASASGGFGVLVGNYISNVAIRRLQVNAVAGLAIGIDSGSIDAQTTTGVTINGCEIVASLGHGLLLGMGSIGAVVTGSRITGGDVGIVDKGTTTVVVNCIIQSGTASAYLCKGAVGGSAYNCTMYGTPSAGLIRNDGTGTRLNQSCSFRNLALAAYSGACLAWTDANDESPSYMIFSALVIDGATGLGDGENPAGGVELSYVGGSGLGANLVPSATSPCSPYSGLAVHIRPLGDRDAYGRPKLRADADCVGGVYPQRDDPRNVLLPVSWFASET